MMFTVVATHLNYLRYETFPACCSVYLKNVVVSSFFFLVCVCTYIHTQRARIYIQKFCCFLIVTTFFLIMILACGVSCSFNQPAKYVLSIMQVAAFGFDFKMYFLLQLHWQSQLICEICTVYFSYSLLKGSLDQFFLSVWKNEQTFFKPTFFVSTLKVYDHFNFVSFLFLFLNYAIMQY